MNAGEGDDIHFLRAAPTLLKELHALIRRLVWKAAENARKVHGRARTADLDRIISLLEPFQEDPQLLDTHLKLILPDLVAAFLEKLGEDARSGLPEGQVPLPKAICKILNVLCKVRGQKVIVGFFSNEPRYLEPILSIVESHPDATHAPDQQSSDWEERYIILLWLSHLMLAPFDLSSISSGRPRVGRAAQESRPSLPPDVPELVVRAVALGVQHLRRATKERDAAALLLVRMCLRPDMQEAGLPEILVRWAVDLLGSMSPSAADVHVELGLLSFLSGLVASSSRAAIASLGPTIDGVVHAILGGDASSSLQSSAVARKWAIKILRNIVCHALRPGSSVVETAASVEGAVEILLRAVGDPATPVRYASSKALSIVTMRLAPAMGAEVIEAVVGCLGEDVLWRGTARDLSAVDPLRWHGLVLTLAHLLYRKAPSADRIPDVLNALLLALAFEQRSATGASVGANVRDAACFGIWAMSRRYHTADLRAVDVKSVRAAQAEGASTSVLQILARALVATSCLDPTGNVRRGASAALQELVGRHPDTVDEGISLVQIVDFHAVGLRDRAMGDVARQAAALHPSYWDTVFHGLLGWRGVGSIDAASRLAAAAAIGQLGVLRDGATVASMSHEIRSSLGVLERRQVEERHGMVVALSQLVTAGGSRHAPTSDGQVHPDAFQAEWEQLWSLFDTSLNLPNEAFSSFALRPELTAAAVCALIAALGARSVEIHERPRPVPSEHAAARATMYLNLTLQRSETSVINVIPAAVRHVTRLIPFHRCEELVHSWLTTVERDEHGVGARGLGAMIAVAAVFANIAPSVTLQERVVGVLVAQGTDDKEISRKVTALRGAKLILSSLSALPARSREVAMQGLRPALQRALNDYTVTERGDVGSLVRLEAIDAVEELWTTQMQETRESNSTFLGPLLRLSAEKLDKVRHKAAQCMNAGFRRGTVRLSCNDASGTSSYDYFAHLLRLLPTVDDAQMRAELIQGYIGSAAFGSSSVVETARQALADFLESLPTGDDGGYSLVHFCGAVVEMFRTSLTMDRIILPLVDVLDFLFDAQILPRLAGTAFRWRTLLSVVQKSHYRSTSMAKLMPAIGCYRGLAGIDETRLDAVSKLTTMLLHPFPKVRTSAAEALLSVTGDDDIKRHDWSRPEKTLRPLVDGMRGRTQVTG